MVGGVLHVLIVLTGQYHEGQDWYGMLRIVPADNQTRHR